MTDLTGMSSEDIRLLRTTGTPNIDHEIEVIGAELEALVREVQESFRERLSKREQNFQRRVKEFMDQLAEMSEQVAHLNERIEGLQLEEGSKIRPIDKGAPSSRASSPSPGEVNLPRALTVQSLERFLLQMGLEVKNHRRPTGIGGGLWAFTSEKALQPVVNELAERGINCRYFRAGQRSRDPRAAWELDSTKKAGVRVAVIPRSLSA
jgi:hypothetical protein